MKFKTVMKKVLSVAVVGAMVMSMAACSGGGDSAEETSSEESTESTEEATEETADSGEGTTIKFQQWWGAELPEGYLDDVVAQYKEDTGVTVELLTAPWADTKTAITAGATNGTIADIISVDGAWLAEFADMGIITDVEAAGVDTSLASDVWEVDGTKYVVPVNVFGYPMYANMDILNEAGVTEVPTTWSELIDACQKVADAGYSAFALNLGTNQCQRYPERIRRHGMGIRNHHQR